MRLALLPPIDLLMLDQMKKGAVYDQISKEQMKLAVAPEPFRSGEFKSNQVETDKINWGRRSQ